jgi:hypothetical protein
MVQCRHRHLSRTQLLLAVVRAADLAVRGDLLVAALARAGQSAVGLQVVGLQAVGLQVVEAVLLL